MVEIYERLNSFFDLTVPGKSHALKDHSVQINKISAILKNENITVVVPGRKFKGPKLEANFFTSFDEAKFRAWHYAKDELYRSSGRYRNSS